MSCTVISVAEWRRLWKTERAVRMPAPAEEAIRRAMPTGPAIQVPKPDDLSAAEFAAVRALTESDWPWASRPYLAARGHDPAVLDALLSRGVVVPWDLSHEKADGRKPAPVGECVTLTELWAERLAVEIVEYGQADRPRWSAWQFDEDGNRVLDEGLPPLLCPQFECRIRWPERIPDPSPGPDEEDEYLIDPYTERPVLFLPGSTDGTPIAIDRRLGKPRKKVSKKKRRRKVQTGT